MTTQTTTYLLCFAHNPVGHACHYIGKTNRPIGRRLWEHKRGINSAALMNELKRRGGTFHCARTWPGDREKELQAQHNSRRLCPTCSGTSAKQHKARPVVTPDMVATLTATMQVTQQHWAAVKARRAASA